MTSGNARGTSNNSGISAEYLFVLGFVSILGQVVLLRELSVAFYGVELIYTLAMGIWLFAGAGGVWISQRSLQPSHTRIRILFILLALGIPLNIAFVRSIRIIFGGIPGAYLPLHIQIVAMAASLLPAGMLLGLLFLWAARIYVANGKSLAGAYAVESLGGMAGGMCATIFFKFGLQNFYIGLLCALVAAGASFLAGEDRGKRSLHPVSLIATAILVLSLWKAPLLDRFMTAWNHPNLVETQDTPYSRVTITLLEDQVSVYENDALLFDSEGTHAEELVHLAALQHPDPARVLVLGGGIEGIVRDILAHSPQIVDYVELNPALLNLVPSHLPAEIQRSLNQGAVRIIVDDPRRFLDGALTYDLILVGMPEPSSGQANRYYTREFFRQCYAKLGDRGVLAFSLPSSENFWPPQLTRRMVSVYRAAKEVFPDVLVLPGSTNVFMGSRERLTRDPGILAERFGSRGIRAKTVSAAYLRYLYTNQRFQDVAATLESGTAPTNTDTRPICYQYTILIWLSKFLPSLNAGNFSQLDFVGSPRYFLSWLIVLSLCALWLSRRRWPVRRTALTGVAGFAAMVLETVLILHFQTRNGILFQDVGILLTGFMAGLALGASAVAGIRQRASRSFGIGVLIALAFLSALIGIAIDTGMKSGLISTLCLLMLAGILVAGIFGYACVRQPGGQETAITPLYSADLIGGAVGSLLASLILVPMAGLGATAYMMIPLVVLSALLV
jgi:spermidine synthase